MKNQNITSRMVFTHQRVSNSGTVYPKSGYQDYTSLRVVSSTNTRQNSGDRVRGTNFSYTVDKIMPLTGSYSYKSTSFGTYTGSGQMYAPSARAVLTSEALMDCQNNVIAAVLDRIRGQIDLSVDAFQLKQTINMIKRPLHGLSAFIKAFRKRTWKRYITRKWKNRPKWSKYFSDKWLEAIYGWYPFVQTAYGIAGQIANISKPGPSLQLFTETMGTDNTQQFPKERLNFAGQNHDVFFTSTDRMKMKAFALLRLSDSAKSKMAATYTSMNPASVRWETLPYSFVVDWFVGIGDFLRACESATIYNAFVDSFWISKTRIINTQAIGTSRSSLTESGSLSGSGTAQRIVFARVAFAEIPMPTRPVLKGVSDLHWTQLTSAFALLRQAFR